MARPIAADQFVSSVHNVLPDTKGTEAAKTTAQRALHGLQAVPGLAKVVPDLNKPVGDAARRQKGRTRGGRERVRMCLATLQDGIGGEANSFRPQ